MNQINKKLVIAPNLNIKWSGVTSTIFSLLPIQCRSIDIVSFGFNIPSNISSISLYKLFKIRKNRQIIWHARRNIEMLFGIFIKFIFRINMKLIFTSAAQRNHSKYTKWLINKMDKIIATVASRKGMTHFFVKKGRSILRPTPIRATITISSVRCLVKF